MQATHEGPSPNQGAGPRSVSGAAARRTVAAGSGLAAGRRREAVARGDNAQLAPHRAGIPRALPCGKM